MKHLIKQYAHFFGEIIRPEKIFPNSLSCFHHLFNLSNPGLLIKFPIPGENQQKSYFCWFFFVLQEPKKQNII
jgi:hypothetical protein